MSDKKARKVRFNFPIIKKRDPMEHVFIMPAPESDDIKPTDNQVAIAVAVFISTCLSAGIFLLSQDWKLFLFVAIVSFILTFKYEAIKKFFHEQMMWLFNIK